MPHSCGCCLLLETDKREERLIRKGLRIVAKCQPPPSGPRTGSAAPRGRMDPVGRFATTTLGSVTQSHWKSRRQTGYECHARGSSDDRKNSSSPPAARSQRPSIVPRPVFDLPPKADVHCDGRSLSSGPIRTSALQNTLLHRGRLGRGRSHMTSLPNFHLTKFDPAHPG
jgi:hypothetical protein